MADKTVPVSYRKGKLRAGGLGKFATLGDGTANQLATMGNHGPEWQTVSTILDNVIGSTRGALLMRGASAWSKIDPGTSGNVLTSNGAAADPSYQQAGSLKFLDIQPASNSAALNFTSGIDSSYSAYEFVIENLVPVTDNDIISMQFSINGGSSYLSSSYVTSSPTDRIPISSIGSFNVSNTSGIGLSGRTTLFNPSASQVTWALSYAIERNSAGSITQVSLGGYNTTTLAVDAVRFLASSGNLSSGTIRMYGIKGS